MVGTVVIIRVGFASRLTLFGARIFERNGLHLFFRFDHAGQVVWPAELLSSLKLLFRDVIVGVANEWYSTVASISPSRSTDLQYTEIGMLGDGMKIGDTSPGYVVYLVTGVRAIRSVSGGYLNFLMCPHLLLQRLNVGQRTDREPLTDRTATAYGLIRFFELLACRSPSDWFAKVSEQS